MYNGGHYGMVLIKNVTTTKGYRHLGAQHYTILTKVVDETIQTYLLQLHNKLSSAQSAFKKGKFLSFPLHHLIFFQIYTYNIRQNLMFIS